jgi:hypothetical protein
MCVFSNYTTREGHYNFSEELRAQQVTIGIYIQYIHMNMLAEHQDDFIPLVERDCLQIKHFVFLPLNFLLQ